MKPTSALSAQESLDIISEMIQVAKGNLQRNAFYFLLWGWVVALANAGMFVLGKVGYDHPYVVWLITIPAWVFTLYKVFRGKRERVTTSHFDRISGWLWICFGITIFILVFFGYRINYQLNPVILLVSAIPTVVSGIILKFRPLIFGGIFFWIAGTVCFLIPMEYQPLVGSVAVAGGYIIPGYALRGRKEADV